MKPLVSRSSLIHKLDILLKQGQQYQSSTAEYSKVYVPPNTLYVISGTDFYGSNDPTNSVKALKEDKSKGLDFNPIRSTPHRAQLCSMKQKHAENHK